jgi:hypothetical protein
MRCQNCSLCTSASVPVEGHHPVANCALKAALSSPVASNGNYSALNFPTFTWDAASDATLHRLSFFLIDPSTGARFFRIASVAVTAKTVQ